MPRAAVIYRYLPAPLVSAEFQFLLFPPDLISMAVERKTLGGGAGTGAAPAGLLPSAARRSGSRLLHVAPAADLSAPLPAPRLPRAFVPFLGRDGMEMREGCGYQEHVPQEEGREDGLSFTSSSGTLAQ